MAKFQILCILILVAFLNFVYVKKQTIPIFLLFQIDGVAIIEIGHFIANYIYFKIATHLVSPKSHMAVVSFVKR